MKKYKATGFTLVELLIVIAIIGILASLVLVSISTAQKRGRDSKRIADTKQMMNALELYYTDNKAYPTTVGWVYSDGGATWKAILPSNYIVTLPQDPLGDTAAHRYGYQSTCGGQGFWYGAILETLDPTKYQVINDDCAGTSSSTLLNSPTGRYVIAKKPI